MRTFVVTATLIATLLASQSPAEAETDRKRRAAERAKVERPARVVDSAEHDRAVACDPAGQYAAYPDWARAAFTCGSSRR